MIKSYTLLLLSLLFVSNHVLSQGITCPPNLDFEYGNLNHWEFATGSCCPLGIGGPAGPTPGRHDLMTAGTNDPFGGFPVVPPNGGNYSLKLGNSSVGAQAESARYYVRVPNGSNNVFTLLYQYAVVFQDPGHSVSQQPRFNVNVYDSATGNPVPCNQFNFVASSNIPGFKQSTVNGSVYYKDWSTSSIDFSNIGGTTVVVEFTTGDCGLGGHFGYGYIDVKCAFFQSYTLYCQNVPTINISGPPGFEQYDWYDSATNTFLGSGQPLTVPTPSQTTTFAVVLKPYTGFGCPDTVYTRFETAPMYITKSGDTIICPGDSAQLDVTANSTAQPFTYSWTPTNGLSCVNCPNPIASPTVTTTYYVTVADTNRCTETDSIIVKVNDSARVNLTIPQDSICMYDRINILNDVNNPATAQYLWDVGDDGNIIDGDNTPSIISTWNKEGKKTVMVTVLNGYCKASDTGEIYVKYTPKAQFDIDHDICIGDNTVLRPVQYDGLYKWEIDEFSIPSTDFKDEYNITWNTLGPKVIKLTTTNVNGCVDDKIDTVVIHEYPEAVIRGDIAGLCIGKPFTLSTEEGLRYKYNWTPPQYFDNQHNATVNGIAERDVQIVLAVTNTWNCTSYDTITVDVPPCCEIVMPDAFTPNNDGVNDHYKPISTNGLEIVSFMIANRRGEVVYDNRDANKGWDGSHNGEPAALDTYNYYIKFLCTTGETKEAKGTVMLLR